MANYCRAVIKSLRGTRRIRQSIRKRGKVERTSRGYSRTSILDDGRRWRWKIGRGSGENRGYKRK
jgi:hypothetical protein